MNISISKWFVPECGFLVLLLTVCLLAPWVQGADVHVDEEVEAEEGRVTMNAATAAAMGVVTSRADAGILHRKVLLYGKTMLDPQRVSHVKARYAGMIRAIGPALGEAVASGDVIATIEANDSLQAYDIRAPIDGIVIDKHANPGELAGNDPLLTIASYERLWVDLAVFPSDARDIRPGLPVNIAMNGIEADSEIRYLIPGEGNSPAITARVPLENPALDWSPGLLVEAQVAVEDIPVSLRIDNRAIQDFRDWRVVFIRIGDDYEIRPVELGRSDGEFTEVLSGLEPGSEYVVESSYLLKADLEKSGTSHDH